MSNNGKDPLDGDFTIYQDKPPSELHELHAALIQELSGIEITAKQVQAVLCMHGKIQASERNRAREGYKARTSESIRKGGATLVEHMDLRLGESEVEAVAEVAETYQISREGRKWVVVGAESGTVIGESYRVKKDAQNELDRLNSAA